MIKTVEPRKGKWSNHAQVDYERSFARKFELIKDLPNYKKLELFAQQCVDLHCGDSLAGISARVYMDKVIAMTDAEFIAWAANCFEASMAGSRIIGGKP